MRIVITCLLLMLIPSAIVIGYKAFEEMHEQQLLRERFPAHGEVLFFNASWCGPCRQMKPIVSRMRGQGYRMRDIDVDKHQDLAQKYGIRSIPTFVFVENGAETHRFSGGTSPENLRKLCDSPAFH